MTWVRRPKRSGGLGWPRDGKMTGRRNAELIRSRYGAQAAIRLARFPAPTSGYAPSSSRSTFSAYIDDFSSTGFAL